MRQFTFLSCEREFHIRGKVPDAKRFTILTRFVKSYYFDTFFDFFLSHLYMTKDVNRQQTVKFQNIYRRFKQGLYLSFFSQRPISLDFTYHITYWYERTIKKN